MKKNLLLTLFICALFVAPLVFATENTTPSKKMGVASTGEEVGEKIQEYKDAVDEKKSEIQEQILERVKERAKYAIQNAVRKYEQVRIKVKALNISEENKSEIVGVVDAQISSMNALSIQIEAATTVDEVKNVTTKLQTQFKYSLGLVKQSIKGVYEDRLANVLEKSVAVYDKIEAKVTELNDGTTKTDLEALLSQAASLLYSAESKLDTNDLEGAKADLVLAKQTMSEVITTLNSLSE